MAYELKMRVWRGDAKGGALEAAVRATVEGISIAGVGHQLPLSGQVAYAIAFLGLDQASS